MQGIELRAGAGLPAFRSNLGRLAPQLGFDGIERADPLKRFRRQGTGVGVMEVVELAPDVRPAGDLDDGTGFVEAVEAGVAVGLQRAAKVAQVISRMLALPVRRVSEPDGRRGGIMAGPVVADVGPQPGKRPLLAVWTI